MLKKLAPFITPHPGEINYIEPFGGSGVVMINKPCHPSETYNDTDGELVNLFRVIRDPDGVVHLWWELINTPVAREEFADSLKPSPHSPLTPVQQAARFVIRCRQRFGGGMSGSAHTDTDRSWGTARGSSRGMNGTVAKWLSVMLQLPYVHRRMCTVVVDRQDAVRCIEQWDNPSALFYVDPPYVGTEDYYQGGFAAKDHRRLATALNAVQGRVALSYYPCPDVDRLYPASRWLRTYHKTYATAAGNKARDPNGKGVKLAKCVERTELILSNFHPVSRKRLCA